MPHHIPLIAVRCALTYANTFARFRLSARRSDGLEPWLRNRLARRFAISN